MTEKQNPWAVGKDHPQLKSAWKSWEAQGTSGVVLTLLYYLKDILFQEWPAEITNLLQKEAGTAAFTTLYQWTQITMIAKAALLLTAIVFLVIRLANQRAILKQGVTAATEGIEKEKIKRNSINGK